MLKDPSHILLFMLSEKPLPAYIFELETNKLWKPILALPRTNSSIKLQL